MKGIYIKKIVKFISNKYAFMLLFLMVWIAFFDDSDLITQNLRLRQLHKLTIKKKYYETEIEIAKKELNVLQSNNEVIEKFAREKYLMKKDGEDVFIIENLPEKE
jgi:cell division protein DivIC